MNEQDFVIGPDNFLISSSLLSEVKHTVSTRNLADSSVDRSELAARVRDHLLPGSSIPIALAEQVHGAEVTVIDEKNIPVVAKSGVYEFPGSDALVTNAKGILIGVFTADCVPILFADAEAGVIGAVHAGWRGTYGGILANALRHAVELGARPKRLRAWVGPSICGADYEVSAELAEQFVVRFPDFASQAIHGRHLDLPRLNALMALREGLLESNISISGLCTRERIDLLWSYRVDGESAGRIFSAIGQ